MNKKTMSILVSLFLIVVLAACGGNKSEQPSGQASKEDSNDKIVLKLATHEAPGAFFSKTVTEPFMDRVTELTDGQVEFDFYPSEQLGNVSDYLDLTSQGATDIAFFISTYTSDRMPYTSKITGLPGLSESSNQASQALHNLIQQEPVLTTDYLNNGVRPIIGYATPPYDFFSASTLVKLPEDLNGLQVRSSGAFMNELIKFFGGTPVTVATPELYEAVEKGVIDSVGQYATTLDSFSLGDVLKYGSEGVSFTSGNAGLIMNEGKWKSLPENVQKAIQQAADEVVNSGSKADDEEREKVVEEWSKTMEIYQITDEDKQKWAEKFDEFNTQWLKEQDDEFNKVLDEYRSLLDRYKE